MDQHGDRPHPYSQPHDAPKDPEPAPQDPPDEEPQAPKEDDQASKDRIGEPMHYQNEPNIAAKDQPAGQMSTRFASGGKVFQAYGTRFETVPDGYVLCTKYEDSDPKNAYVMPAPTAYEYDPEEHA